MTDKKLIPFNLERALAGDPVVTRDGRKVLQIAYFPNMTEDRRVAVHIEGLNYLLVVSGNGICFLGEKAEAEDDLFMASKTKTYWVNVYIHNMGGFLFGSVSTNKEMILAEKHDCANHLKTISFEIEEE